MKILFITTKTPLPTNDGHSIRSFNLLKAVAAHHEITLLSFVKFPVEYDYVNELEKICSSVTLFPIPENRSRIREKISVFLNLASNRPYVADKYNHAAMRMKIRSLLAEGGIDLVHLDMLPLCVYLDEIRLPVVLNEHNVESILLKRKFESIANPLLKWFYISQHKRLSRFEVQALRSVTHTIACSRQDELNIQSIAPGIKTSVVPNGVDTEFYRPLGLKNQIEGSLLFIGGMNWFPNKDAILWFDRVVLPGLLKLNSKVHLNVVGKLDNDLEIVHTEHMTIHGFVDDTRPYLEQSSVMIVPIRVGGGTRLKILEAMSMGMAIVTTSIGVEGIEVIDKKHVYVADTPEEFAVAVEELLHDKELRRRLGSAAREFVDDCYRWDRIGSNLLQVYGTAMQESSDEH